MAGHSFNERLSAPELPVEVLEAYFGEDLDWISVFARNLRNNVHFSTATLFFVHFHIIVQRLHLAQTRRTKSWHPRTTHTRLPFPPAVLRIRFGKRTKHFWAWMSQSFHSLIDFDGSSEVCLGRVAGTDGTVAGLRGSTSSSGGPASGGGRRWAGGGATGADRTVLVENVGDAPLVHVQDLLRVGWTHKTQTIGQSP